jgi:hypothetical protein
MPQTSCLQIRKVEQSICLCKPASLSNYLTRDKFSAIGRMGWYGFLVA